VERLAQKEQGIHGGLLLGVSTGGHFTTPMSGAVRRFDQEQGLSLPKTSSGRPAGGNVANRRDLSPDTAAAERRMARQRTILDGQPLDARSANAPPPIGFWLSS
jgi:hypothetical protein